MTNYIGDFAPGSTVVATFTTVNTSGVPTALAGSPAAAIFKGTNSSALTAGISLVASYASALPGTSLVSITTNSDATNYTAGSDYTIALTSGSVGGTTITGYTVGQFSLSNRGIVAGVSGITVANVTQVNGAAAVTSSAQLGVNIVTWEGASPAPLIGGLIQTKESGTPGVNVTQINGIPAATSSAQLGVNVVTWEGAVPAPLVNALVQTVVSGTPAVNVTQINGVATITSAAQLGVNVFTWAGGVVPQPNVAGEPLVDVNHWRGTQPANLSSTFVQSIVASGVSQSNLVQWEGAAPAALVSGLVQTQVSGTPGVNVLTIAGQTAVLDGNNRLKVDVDDWNGTLVGALPANFSSLAIDVSGNVSITSNIKKNTAVGNFMFVMTDSTSHMPKTNLSVTATRSLDGASFGACANAVTEIGNGWYQINLAVSDTNANRLALRFIASGADDLDLLVVSQP